MSIEAIVSTAAAIISALAGVVVVLWKQHIKDSEEKTQLLREMLVSSNNSTTAINAVIKLVKP